MLDLAGNSPVDVVHQFARLQTMTAWWHWLLLFAACVGLVVFVVAVYRRDGFELTSGKRWALMLLRVAALAGILVFFLDLEKRSQREVVENSRAVILVDTSLSMGIQDDATQSGGRRIDQVVSQISEGDLIPAFRQDHDVIVYRFGESEAPSEVASLKKIPSEEEATLQPDTNATAKSNLRDARLIAIIAAVFLGVAFISFMIHISVSLRGQEREGSWALLIGTAGLVVASVVFAVANLRHPEISVAETIGLRSLDDGTEQPATDRDSAEDANGIGEPILPNWPDALAPQGGATRLGDALRYVLQQERGNAVAGIVLITDGGQNAGVDPSEAIALAKGQQIPIFPIGLGGTDRPQNVRVIDVEAPTRVYPGDSFTLNGYIQSYGLAGRTVTVSLHSFDASVDPDEALAEFEEDRPVRLGDDGSPVSIRFEVTPREQGVRRYELSVAPPEQDTEQRDNQKSAKVQIVARKNRVLLMAGGPTREYRFLRDLLYRDRDTNLSVWLQTASTGMSQEADQLLSEFPATPSELFEYDCIVAFDPDWLALEVQSVKLLERWVSEEAGGLVLVAGPVHTPQWANRVRSDPRISTLRGLYPVIFYGRGSSMMGLGRFSSETAWPLQFTPDGRDAEFLWLGDDASDNASAWNSFDGVYGYYAVKDPKLGARVYSRFSDPTTAVDGDLPIYMAGHFFGAGRVFFQASGEMWRIRSVDDTHFERYYTKLIRWASQGRLLRDSSRGVLLVDKSRCLLGDNISVRAILTDAQHRPLAAEQVTAALVHPNGSRTPFVLRRLADATQGGMFAAQFTAVLEGDYRIELQPPHGDDDELLARDVRVRIPAREIERPERNDPLLGNVAEQTGGRYFIGFESAMTGETTIQSLLRPQDRVSYVEGAPDKKFERILMTWLLGIICGALSLEWLIRRLSRLA